MTKLRVFCDSCKDFTGTMSFPKQVVGEAPRIRIPFECHGDVDYCVVTRTFLDLFNEVVRRDPKNCSIVAFRRTG